jgi:superfamily II DNA or RNA helicase
MNTFTPWPHQEYALAEIPRLIDSGTRRVLETTPTGGGKSLIMCGLIEWAVARGWKVVLYTNRRLLIDQLARVLTAHGIEFGVRSAGHEHHLYRPVQLSSLPTEQARVFKAERWALHGAGEKVLAIVDEAHLNKAAVAGKVLRMHHAAGGAYVGFTATPIGLAHLYDTLVVAGTPLKLRECGSLVPAYHFGPDEPEMKGFRQNVKTGEYTEGDVRKAIMTKAIKGRVLENYRRTNPDGRPTLLFAPGVRESVWFAQQLSAAGVPSAHVDGEGVWWNGEYSRTANREELFEALRSGELKVLSNRFVLREGLDLPFVSHLILATVMGSLGTYLQSAGRGLRAAPGKDRLTIQDHGGHWWRHGSVNADRQWRLAYTENVIAGLRHDAFTIPDPSREPEPIVCPECGLVRSAGPKCPGCKREAGRRARVVIQADGSLREHEGDIFKPRKVRALPDTARLWTNCYYRAKNSRNRMTFRQAEGLFFCENGYYPPRNLPLMPTEKIDRFLPVADVPPERLVPKPPAAATPLPLFPSFGGSASPTT